nr:ABC transporter ATP-binding protein [Tissierella sp.]
MFQIKDLKFKSILNIHDLKIKENKITSIVGKSGSGKTTFLKMLNKMITPDSGSILYNNRDIKEIDAVQLRREVIMLGQTPAIFPGNIRDNLLIGRKFSGKEALPDQELTAMLKKLGLNKSLNEEASNLSGGEQQRVALGRVIIADPQVFLLDEPSSALDSKTENLIISSLADYSKENNKTLIMVTHSLDIGREFSDFIIEIKNKDANLKEDL